MDKLQSIKISLIRGSDTNVRKKGFDDPGFDDFVASIREKGVLVPIIIRQTSKSKYSVAYEVVAGNRRLRAAKIAGLEEIPAIIRKLTDDEAREVQIIENLQRLDIHPLDEGFGYRQLIEKSKYTIENIAIRVGKSQDYIRQRLFLTNLIEKAVVVFREGKITDGHAVLIAKLSFNDQLTAIKYLREDSWVLPSIREFKTWIEQNFYRPLKFQPWLKDKEANEAVGKCVECPPNKNSLFGAVKEGACTDLKCWSRKMEKFIDYQIAKAKEQGIELLKVSKEYGSAKPGIISASDYTSLSFKKKEQCKYAQKAIVADGSDVGTFLWICANSECPKHHYQHADYQLTPKEKERRRKEARKARLKKEKEEKIMVETLNKIEWPLEEKVLDIMFELVLYGNGTTILRPVAKRFEISPKKKKSGSGEYVYTYYDWEGPIREAAKEMNKAEKARFIIGILFERMWNEEMKKKFLKIIGEL